MIFFFIKGIISFNESYTIQIQPNKSNENRKYHKYKKRNNNARTWGMSKFS